MSVCSAYDSLSLSSSLFLLLIFAFVDVSLTPPRTVNATYSQLPSYSVPLNVCRPQFLSVACPYCKNRTMLYYLDCVTFKIHHKIYLSKISGFLSAGPRGVDECNYSL